MQPLLASVPIFLNLFGFATCAAMVWFAGARLTRLMDILSDRYNWAKSVTGLLVLSFATSLPEVATTLSAAVQQSRELVLNNLFGGIALQTAILAAADFWAKGPITNYPRKANHALEATILVLLLAITLIVIQLGEPVSIVHFGAGSVFVGLAYAGAIWLLRWYDGASDWVPVDLPDADTPIFFASETGQSASNRSLHVQAIAVCIAILIFGLLIVEFAQSIADQSGLGRSFIGVTLLAGATSLPELTTTITAVRLGAYTMAISNIFGSNLIMLVLVLPADALFLAGPILRNPSSTVQLALGFGIAVTSIYLIGLIVRRKPRFLGAGLDSWLVLFVFIGSLVAYYFAI